MNGYERHRLRTPIAAILVPVVLFAILGFLAWQFLWPRRQGGGDPSAMPRVVEARGDLAEDEKSTIALFKAASPSVVNITSLAVRQGFLNLDVQQIPQGSGSGFIWDDQGHVVTNYHVIQNAGAARVTLSDHSTWDARVVGAYPDSDLAVLWINAPKGRLRPLPIGASDDLQVGQKAFAIGNPFGLDQTLTTGIVSAVGREIESVTRRPIKGVIQTDAAINPGNSGGPLLDSAGRLIGVNTAIFSPSGASAGIGFAIPVDEVNRIVPQLIANGKVIRPGLGIHIAEDQITRRLGLEGVLILNVQPGGPAAKAGLRGTRRDENNEIVLGDVITAIDDTEISRVNDLHGVLQTRKVGDTVTVTVLRDGEERQIEVMLDAIK
jgi:S1-C subfamily serine protease